VVHAGWASLTMVDWEVLAVGVVGLIAQQPPSRARERRHRVRDLGRGPAREAVLVAQVLEVAKMCVNKGVRTKHQPSSKSACPRARSRSVADC